MPSKAIETVEELEKYACIKISKKDRKQMQEVLEKFPVKFTDYLINLMKTSPAVKKQFVPTLGELTTLGIQRPWVGKIETKIYGLERMYTDRLIIMPINQCPAYCRHCVRKNYITRAQRAMTYEEINRAVEYIKQDKRIKEILITGGDPLMDLKRLEYIIKGLRKINHIGPIRIGTRSIVYDPERIDNKFIAMLKKYHSYKNGNPIELSPQFNHPDELTKESIYACRKLLDAGMRLYNQSVLLKGINDKPEILADLYRKLRIIGVELHYLYHCVQVGGADQFRTSVQRGIEIKRYFAGGYLSGRANPRYIILTPVGKMEPLIDGEILGRKGNLLTIKTPYTEKQFREINSKFKLPKGCKVDKKGFIIAEYLDGKD